MKAPVRLWRLASSWIVAVLLLPALALSHPCRTDSSGGHFNRKAGEYHFHGGGGGVPARTESYTEDKGERKTQNVYVTRTGHKYHRDGCRYLKSRIPVSLKEARAVYAPCSVCQPPE